MSDELTGNSDSVVLKFRAGDPIMLPKNLQAKTTTYKTPARTSKVVCPPQARTKPPLTTTLPPFALPGPPEDLQEARELHRPEGNTSTDTTV